MQVANHNLAALARFVVEKIGADHKIECIRTYRELTGFGLKEAKDIIEATLAPVDPVLKAVNIATGLNQNY